MITRQQALAFRRKIEHAAAQQTDEDALQSIELFPKWEPDIVVTLGERRQDEGILYRCVQPHTTQADWRPKDTPALWAVVSIEEWPEIPEVIPAEAPWMKGDKGTWKGRHYICQMDNCVWNPDTYPAAWELVEN